MPNASVVFDASVLAVPPIDGPSSAAHRYVESLLDWVKLLEEPWIAICMSERASEALITDGLYPMREQLKQLFSRHGIVEYDVNTVAIVIDQLLTHTPSFETYFRVQDVLAEDVSTEPDVLQLCAGDDLQAELARCLVLLAILRRHCGTSILENAFIVREAPGQSILVRALVHDFEHCRQDMKGALPNPPDFFEGHVLVCDNFGGLLNCIDEGKVLSCAEDDAGIEIAIRIALYKSRLTRQVEPNWDDIAGMRLGSDFRGLMQRCCGDAPPAVTVAALRCACEAIDRQNLRAVHALRAGMGGNAPQRLRARDGAKAWRRDIDHEYHLHYWEMEDGTIEFASMVVHNDFSIPE